MWRHDFDRIENRGFGTKQKRERISAMWLRDTGFSSIK